MDEVVTEWIRLKATHGLAEPWTFSEAVAACITHKRDLGVTEHHLRPLKVKMSRLALTFGDRLCDQIATEELEAYARPRAKTPHTWRNYRRDLGIVFNFAIQRGRATKNPAKNMPRPQFQDTAPDILKLSQVLHLLSCCPVECYSYVTLGLFAGLRPFETVRMTPGGINLNTLVLTVTGKRTRSRSRRFVTIKPNLARWLEIHLKGEWVNRTYWNVRDMIQEAARKSGINLTPDVFRHSFASHFQIN